MNIELQSMAIDLPRLAGAHPNRAPFRGVLTLVDTPSDRAPSGARGHRVVLTRAAAEQALPSLLGMGLDYTPLMDRHDTRHKVGIITEANLVAGRQAPGSRRHSGDGRLAPPLPNAFHLAWGIPEIVKGAEAARRPLMKIVCTIAYRIAGAQSGSVDRGRALAALDSELLRLAAPPRTPKRDQTHIPAVELGSTVFWGMPEFGAVASAHDELRRQARLAVFFFSEVDQA